MQKSRVILVILTLLAFVCSASVASAAGWKKEGQYWRDRSTGLLWSTDTGNIVSSHQQAKAIAQKMGGRLPTWEELRDVVNNNDGVDQLDIQDGPLDYYETAKANELASAYGGSISSRIARNYFWAAIGRHRVIVIMDN